MLHKEGNEISFKPETVMPPQDAVPQRPTLTGVKTYNHVAHDPFAQFEQEFQSTPTPQTQVVEETVVVVEEEISITVNDDEGDNENAADELSAAEQALQNLKAQLTQPQEEVNEELQEEYEEEGCNGDIPDEEAFEEHDRHHKKKKNDHMSFHPDIYSRERHRVHQYIVLQLHLLAVHFHLGLQ